MNQGRLWLHGWHVHLGRWVWLAIAGDDMDVRQGWQTGLGGLRKCRGG